MKEPYQRRLWDRGRPGTKRKYENSADLWNACCDYFEWCEANPIIEKKAHAYMGDYIVSDIPRVRPMTKWGLWSFMGITQKTWEKYRDYSGDHDEYIEMAEIARHVENIMMEQKVACAATDQMNPGFIAKEIGLADKQQVDHTSSDGSIGPSRIELVPVANANDSQD